MTFEELRKANESIKATNIQGKEYAEVNQRIKAFRMCYPEGAIFTEMVSCENGVCIFKAMIYGNGDKTVNSLLGVGHAYEKEGSSFINKTSYIENCETSAVGRALGMAGFGIDTSVASAEEVQNAMLNQKKPEEKRPEVPLAQQRISQTQIDALKALITETGSDAGQLLDYYEVNVFNDLTNVQWKQAMDILTKRKNAKNPG